jgi:F0F1-type ATP synthase assembly protein I
VGHKPRRCGHRRHSTGSRDTDVDNALIAPWGLIVFFLIAFCQAMWYLLVDLNQS